jgi:hypothetical protein
MKEQKIIISLVKLLFEATSKISENIIIATKSIPTHPTGPLLKKLDILFYLKLSSRNN